MLFKFIISLVRCFAVGVWLAADYELLPVTSEYRNSGFTISQKIEKKIFPCRRRGPVCTDGAPATNLRLGLEIAA
jgi:hypothetical protein